MLLPEQKANLIANDASAAGEPAHSQVVTPTVNKTDNALGSSTSHIRARMITTNYARAVGKHITHKSTVFHLWTPKEEKEEKEEEKTELRAHRA
jgi:hypothetical protein